MGGCWLHGWANVQRMCPLSMPGRRVGLTDWQGWCFGFQAAWAMGTGTDMWQAHAHVYGHGQGKKAQWRGGAGLASRRKGEGGGGPYLCP